MSYTLHLAQPGTSSHPVYIQSRGLHTGRPMRKATANCWQLVTDQPNPFGLAYAAYIAGLYHPYHRGSVIPFVTRPDLEEVLRKVCDLASPHQLHVLAHCEAADALLRTLDNSRVKAAALRLHLATLATKPNL